MRAVLLCAVLAAGCDDGLEATVPDAAVAPEPEAVTSRLSIIDYLDIEPETEGVSEGFDIDDSVSTYLDDATCRKGDFVAPDGTEGIDNQLAKLLPALEAAGATALPGLVQGAIRDGGLLVMFQIDDAQDWVNDDDVRVTARIGSGRPLLGTDGELLSGQTFALHDDTPDTVAAAAHIEDGVLYAGPLTIALPIVVFQVQYQLTLSGAYLRAELTFDGGMADGVVGGAVSLAELTEIARVADSRVMGDPFTTVLVPLMRNAADVNPGDDGVCTSISAALEFSAVSGFLFDAAAAYEALGNEHEVCTEVDRDGRRVTTEFSIDGECDEDTP